MLARRFGYRVQDLPPVAAERAGAHSIFFCEAALFVTAKAAHYESVKIGANDAESVLGKVINRCTISWVRAPTWNIFRPRVPLASWQVTLAILVL